jgi:hypothetical protein
MGEAAWAIGRSCLKCLIAPTENVSSHLVKEKLMEVMSLTPQ